MVAIVHPDAHDLPDFEGDGHGQRTLTASGASARRDHGTRHRVFRLWIAGTLQTGDGKVTGGNLEIHRFEGSAAAETDG
jgi:hypothetical protein